MIEGVVNELSGLRSPLFERPIAESIEDARHFMRGFVTCVSEGFRQKYLSALRTDPEFSLFEITAGYSIDAWGRDSVVDRDERIRFRRFVTATPYLARNVEEVTYAGIRARGFSSCWANDSMAISWASEPAWEQTEISVEVLQLTEAAEFVTVPAVVRNASNFRHWQILAEWIRFKFASKLTCGADVLEASSRLFKFLDFGVGAARQLRELTGRESSFRWIIQALLSAESEMSQWTEGPFPHRRLPGPATGESESVHNDPRLKKMRVFQTHSGTWEFMEHHMKYMGENQRIHYLVDGKNRRMVIGYLGEHLETARY